MHPIAPSSIYIPALPLHCYIVSYLIISSTAELAPLPSLASPCLALPSHPVPHLSRLRATCALWWLDWGSPRGYIPRASYGQKGLSVRVHSYALDAG